MFPSTSKAQSIHINPVFKDEVLQKIRNNCEEPAQAASIPSSAHINPRFINASKAKAQTIYMNPEFLNANFKQHNKNEDVSEDIKTNPHIESKTPSPLPKVTQLNKIITKSRTRLVREHIRQRQRPLQQNATKSTSPILLLTKRKLVRSTTATDTPTTSTMPTVKKVTATTTKGVRRYKLDNKLYTLKRTAATAAAKRRTVTSSFVARYALRRCGGSSKLANTKTGATKTAAIGSLNKRLRLVNINGILYRSSQTKLQRRIEESPKPLKSTAATKSINDSTKTSATNRPKGRTVYVRGTKFILDPQGFKLTRVNTTTGNVIAATSPFSTAKNVGKTARAGVGGCGIAGQPRRIDIGGHTYVASSSNVFVRTSTHLVLAHLNQAKHRSVSVLSRCLRKVNKPCVIFQRLGKCAALERNRCSKIHDKQQVIVCPKFLQGACTNTHCLLSHNKTYQKMPVCKFFLQGCCVREDCAYLHKKLSEGSDICEDFRRGFCVLGEKCDKQHIFPEAKPKTSSSTFLSTNATPLVSKQQQLLVEHGTESLSSLSPVEENAMTLRYFSDENLITELANKVDISAATTVSMKDETETVNNSPASSVHEAESIDVEHEDDEVENVDSQIIKRQPLGSLPAFIPLC